MSFIGAALAGLGISLGSKFLSPVINGVSNLISGGTWRQSGDQVAQNEFNAEQAVLAHERSIEADATKYQRAVQDISDAGLNPNMVYASGGVNAQGPTSSSASAGSGSRGAFQSNMNILSEVSGLLNSVTNARALDHAIDRNSKNRVTQRMYNEVGELVSTIVKTVT